MTGTAKVTGAPLRLRRTEHIEELLQAIWVLRPELDRKNTITLTFGLKAFLEDCQAKALNSPTTSTNRYLSGESIESGTDKIVATEAAHEGAVPVSGQGVKVSDDIEW